MVVREARRVAALTVLLASFATASLADTRGPRLPFSAVTEAATARCLAAHAAAMEAVGRGDWALAAEHFRRATEAFPEGQMAWYNLACALARLGEAAEALRALERAGQLGRLDEAQLEADPDLEALRPSAGYQQLLGRLRARPSLESVVLADHELGRAPDEIDRLAADAMERLTVAGPTLGSRQWDLAVADIARWKAASFDALSLRAADASERERMEWEALRSLLDERMTPASELLLDDVLRRASAPSIESSAHAIDAAFAAAFARWALDALATPDRIASAETMERYRRDLLAIAAASPDRPELERVLVRLTSLTQDDLPLAKRLYARLLAVAADPAAARRAAQRDAPGAVLAVEGIPAFHAVMMSGETLSNDTFKGRMTLVHCWATWCPPCIAELPRARAVSDTARQRGVHVLGIAVERGPMAEPAAFTEWCRERKVDWPHVLDGREGVIELAATLGITAIPNHLLIDEEGRVVAAGTLDNVAKELERRRPPEAAGTLRGSQDTKPE